MTLDHDEFVVKMKDGKYDWLDPVESIFEGRGSIIVRTCAGYDYIFNLKDIDQWMVRQYDAVDIYPFGR